MADQIATRFGVLGRELSLAVLHTVELTARKGVDALDRADRRVHAGAALELVPAEAPGQRWRMLLESLFPTSRLLLDRHTPPPPGLSDLDSDPAQERIIRKVLTATAAFLLAESTTLEETSDLLAMLNQPAEADVVELEQLLQTAANASATLLDHAENGTWRALLASFRPAPLLPAPAGALARQAGVARRPPERSRVLKIGMVGVGFGGGKTYALELGRQVLERELAEVVAADRVPEIYALGTDPVTTSLLCQLAGRGLPHHDQRPRVRYILPADPPVCESGLAALELPWSEPACYDTPGPSPDGPSRVAALHAYLKAALQDRPAPLDRLIVTGTDDHPVPQPVSADGGPGAVARLPGLAGCEVILVGRHTREALRFWEEQFAAAGARRITVAGDIRHRGVLRLGRAVAGSATATWATATGATASWSTTARAALLLALCTIGAVVTILALGHAELNGYALLLVLIGVGGMVTANIRPPLRDHAWFTGRRSRSLPNRQREDTTV